VWDKTAVSCFSWVCYDVSNYEYYTAETTYENSLVYQASSLQLSSLLHVMHSLTYNAREIFCLLVKQQLASAESSTYVGTCFGEYRDIFKIIVVMLLFHPVCDSVVADVNNASK